MPPRKVTCIRTIIAATAVLVLMCSCVRPHRSPKQRIRFSVPEHLVATADSIIRAVTGEPLFASFFTHDSLKSGGYSYGLAPKKWHLVYRFHMPEKPWVDEDVELWLRSDRSRVPGRKPEGIPSCLSNPEDCRFSVDSASAIQIAQKTWPRSGRKAPYAEFRWVGGETHRYLWVVKSRISRDQTSHLHIDPGNGDVLSRGIVTIVCRLAFQPEREGILRERTQYPAIGHYRIREPQPR